MKSRHIYCNILSSMVLATLLLSSCKDQSGFSGGVNQKASPPTPAQDAKPQPTPVPTPQPVTPDCTDHGQTSAQLLSTTIVNGAMNQLLRYKVSIKNCLGQAAPLTATHILFDMDAFVPQPMQVKNLSYLITAENTNAVLGSGVMQAVHGHDLFGVAGLDRFHHRTNNIINLPAGIQTVNFAVDLSGFIHHNFMYANIRAPAIETINTFLRFGNAAPVTQPVQFQNPPGTP